MVYDADRRPISRRDITMLSRGRCPATSWPTQILVAGWFLRRYSFDPLAVPASIESLDFCVLEIDNVVTRMNRPIAADFLDMRTPCTVRLENLAHWTGLGSLVDRAVSEAHDGQEEGEGSRGSKERKKQAITTNEACKVMI